MPSTALPTPPPGSSPQRRGDQLLVPTLQVGTVTAVAGSFIGAMVGIVRSETPALFSLVSGAQWFVLGSSYYASRQVVLGAWSRDKYDDPPAKVKASAIAGGFAGLVGGALRGPRNIIPGMVVFSVLGAGGQAVTNATGKGDSKPSQTRGSWLDSKWSPLTPLTDQQYEAMLREKILRLDAEIALLDDDIAQLKGSRNGRAEEHSPR